MVKVTVLQVFKTGRTVDYERISVVVGGTNDMGGDPGRLARSAQSQRME
jgi:hypothetical protein